MLVYSQPCIARDYITVSMTVGPASGVLKGAPAEEWRPMDVALTVLIDRWGGWFRIMGRVGGGLTAILKLNN